MMDSVPSIAPTSPPLTGASSIVLRRAATRVASWRVATGEMLLMSTRIDPGASPARMPSGAVSTPSTSAVSGSMVNTTVEARATSAGLLAADAPAATSSATGPRLRLCTVTP